MRVVSRLGWALAVAVVVGLVASAASVERWVGTGGQAARLRFDVTLPADDPRAHAERVAAGIGVRLHGRAPVIEPSPAAGVLTVEADGGEHEAALLEDLLTRAGRLELAAIVHGTDLARAWYLEAQRGSLGADVAGAEDSWADRAGAVLTDHFLRADSPQALDAALARLDPVPDDLRVVYERVLPWSGDDEPGLPPERLRPFYRTYLVTSGSQLDGRDVAGASVEYDQFSLRPEVLITFTEEGGQRFAELTEAIAGHKLAIIVDGEVTSAPIILQRIAGGIATITMGGADNETMNREASVLVNALRSGAILPDGLQATLTHARPGTAGHHWLPRVFVALLAAIGAFLGAPLVARHAVVGRALPVASGSRGAGPLLLACTITVALPAVLLVAAPHLLLPGIDGTALSHMLARVGDTAPLEQFSVLSLGIVGIVGGFWVVELVAALVPRWRRRRLGTPADRRGLDLAALVVGLVLAAIQAVAVAAFVQQLNGPGVELAGTGDGAFALMVLSLLAGVAVHVVVADLVTRHGVCNGYVALLAVGAAHHLYRLFTTEPFPGHHDLRVDVAAGIAAVALVGAVASSLRDDGPDRRRLPWTGAVPAAALGVAASLLFLGLQLLTLQDSAPLDLSSLDFFLRPPTWFAVAFALAAGAGLILCTRGAGGARSTVGVLVSAGFVVALVLIRALAPATLGLEQWLLPTLVLTALAVDARALVLARLGMAAPTIVLAVHDVDRAQRAGDALADAGITATVENLRLRALLRGLGAYAPIVLRVDRADAELAARAIADAEAARDPHVAAFAG